MDIKLTYEIKINKEKSIILNEEELKSLYAKLKDFFEDENNNENDLTMEDITKLMNERLKGEKLSPQPAIPPLPTPYPPISPCPYKNIPDYPYKYPIITCSVEEKD